MSYPRARAFYALKGNKTLEFWRYRLAPEGWVPGGVQALDRGDGRVRFAVGPNPVVGRSARLSWSLAPNVSKRVLVLDAAGRVVGRQALGSERSGEARLSLDGLSAGVYLVSLEGIDGTTRKLVIQK